MPRSDRELHEFCGEIESLRLESWRQALAVLWYMDQLEPDTAVTSGRLATIIHEAGLGNPHATRLREAIRKSGLVVFQGQQTFRLKHISRTKIRAWIESVLDDTPPKVDHALGYLPEAVWRQTRNYVEHVAVQLNGCFDATYYDAASVMLRRLVETLIIEAYETLKRQDEIKNSDGHFFMLGDLVTRANGVKGIGLGRNTKKALVRIKEQGDNAAHNRRFKAVKADLVDVQSGARIAVDELIQLANLRRNPN